VTGEPRGLRGGHRVSDASRLGGPVTVTALMQATAIVTASAPSMSGQSRPVFPFDAQNSDYGRGEASNLLLAEEEVLKD